VGLLSVAGLVKDGVLLTGCGWNLNIVVVVQFNIQGTKLRSPAYCILLHNRSRPRPEG